MSSRSPAGGRNCFLPFPILGTHVARSSLKLVLTPLCCASLFSNSNTTRSAVKDHPHLFHVRVIWTYLWGNVRVKARIFLTYFYLQLNGHVYEVHGVHFPLKKAHSSHSLPLENLHTPYWVPSCAVRFSDVPPFSAQ